MALRFKEKGQLAFFVSIGILIRITIIVLGKGGGSHKRVRGNRIFRLHLIAQWAAELVRHPNLISAVKKVILFLCHIYLNVCEKGICTNKLSK